MKLTIATESSGQVFSVDIGDDLSLADLKAYLEAETDIASENQTLLLNSQALTENSKNLKEIGIADNDLIVIRQNSLNNNNDSEGSGVLSSSAAIGNQVDRQIEELRLKFLNNETLRNQLNMTNPAMAAVLDKPEEFKGLALAQVEQFSGGGFNGNSSTRAELAELQRNPDSIENQKRIMELIQQEAIEENMKLAYEISPESFTQVHMLYVNLELNKVPVKAFVDTGAQATILSPKLAEKCGLSKLIDTRFKGEARGVGTTQILGRIHSAPLKIGDAYVPCSFTVIDTSVDLLLGLDMLRRHAGVVDLKKNVLILSDVETPFLSEAEIPNNLFTSPVQAQVLGGGGPSSSSSVPIGSAAAAAAAATKRQKLQQQSTILPNGGLGSSSSSGSGSSSVVDESKVTQLINLGFQRAEVINALQQCDGNVDLAASLLFQ